MKKLLRKIRKLMDKIFGSKSKEIFWQFRHFFNKKWTESYISEDSINHPHRKPLIEKISNYYPFESVLELGSGPGPNLYLLAKKFPKVKFYGIDISKKAIETGRKYFLKEGINNVFLSSGNMKTLKKFQKKNFDIIFTDATLIYFGEDKINLVIKEMVRITKKAIILCEQHTDFSSFYNDHWIHNYKLLFQGVISNPKIKFTKILPKIWGEDWRKFGYIIEVIL